MLLAVLVEGMLPRDVAGIGSLSVDYSLQTVKDRRLTKGCGFEADLKTLLLFLSMCKAENMC